MGREAESVWSSKRNKMKRKKNPQFTEKITWNYKYLKICSEEQMGSVCDSVTVSLLDVCGDCEKEGRVVGKQNNGEYLIMSLSVFMRERTVFDYSPRVNRSKSVAILAWLLVTWTAGSDTSCTH